MATKVFETDTGQKKRAIRFGANRLMTFKEAKTIPDYILKRHLAALEVKKDRAALKLKREEAHLEMSLQALSTSFGEYAKVETAEDVRAELKKGIRKQMNAQREQEERAKAAEKAAQGHIDQQTEGEASTKKEEEARLSTPVREAMRRRKKEALARKMKNPRPKYSDLITDDRIKRHYTNTRSYDRLMESYGRGKNDDKLEEWLNVVYPKMDHMSATIIGMKKRLERFHSREAMETNPKEGGLEKIMNDYKVFSMYPEILKMKRAKRRRERRDSKGSGGSRSDSIHLPPLLPPIKSDSIGSKDRSSMDGISEGDIHLEMDSGSKTGSLRSGDSHKKRGRRGSSESRSSNGKGIKDAVLPVKLPPAPKKGILHLPPVQAKPSALTVGRGISGEETQESPPKKERKRVAIMTPIVSRDGTMVDGFEDETRDEDADEKKEQKKDHESADIAAMEERMRSDGPQLEGADDKKSKEGNSEEKAEKLEDEDALAELAVFRERMRNAAARRKSSTGAKNAAAAAAKAAENKEKIEEIKQQILAMRRGDMKDGDFEMEMSRRRSLMLLMGDDYDVEDMEWLVEADDPKKLWKDVQNCRYLRGHEPAEMQVPEGPLPEFVFWKGDFARESTFERERSEQRERERRDGDETSPGYDSDAGAISSVAEATRRQSIDLLNRK